MLPNDPTMRFLRGHDYGAEFEIFLHDPLREFRDFCRQPDSRFLTPKLERTRTELQRAIQSFLEAGSNTIFPGGRHGWFGIPREWLHTGSGTPSYERFQTAQQQLNGLANQLCVAYDEFIRQGRNTLDVVRVQ